MANTASRAASGALSRSLRRPVSVSVPEFAVSLLEQLPAVLGQGARPLVAVKAELLGDISGPLAWVMTRTEAVRMAGILLARSGSVALNDMATQAVLTRSAHTLAGAYADVLAALTHGVVFLSVPQIVEGTIDRLLARRQVGREPRQADQLTVCVGSRLGFDDQSLAVMGHLVFLPHHPTFGRILRALAD